MKTFILGVIFARGGSKGIPKKNIIPLAGKPLIAYAIETALAVALIDDLIVSTDDEEIASVARQFGASVPFMRPRELATDESSMRVAQQHALKTYEALTSKKVDVLVSIPTTAPLRAVGDVQACLKALLASDADAVITVTTANRNPYFNMVTLNKNGYAKLVIPSDEPIARRQDAPEVFDVTTVCYALRSKFVLSKKPLLAGKVKTIFVPQERALDIDTQLDLEIAEYLMKKREVKCVP